MVAQGKLAPVLHAVRPLEETPRSIQEVIDRKVVGKTVITPCWKVGEDDYVSKRGFEEQARFGGAYFHISPRRVELEPRLYHFKENAVWTP